MANKNTFTIQKGMIVNLITGADGKLIFGKEYTGTIGFRLGQLYLQIMDVYTNDIQPRVEALYKEYGTEKDGKISIMTSMQKDFDEATEKIMNEEVEVEYVPFRYMEVKDERFMPMEVVALVRTGLMA